MQVQVQAAHQSARRERYENNNRIPEMNSVYLRPAIRCEHPYRVRQSWKQGRRHLPRTFQRDDLKLQPVENKKPLIHQGSLQVICHGGLKKMAMEVHFLCCGTKRLFTTMRNE
jgi:hypothetical protein